MKTIVHWLAAVALLVTDIDFSLAQEKIDLQTIERIKTEAREHSQVMELASWLTDVFGPRLTGSPHTKAAGEWAASKMLSWGLTNVQLERWVPPVTAVFPGPRWDPLDRSWTNERFA